MYSEFQKVFRMNQYELYQYIRKKISKIKEYKQIQIHRDYIIAEGTTPIALVAHLDTVFPERNKALEMFYDQKQQVLWSPQGLGADDRAGICMILDILENTKLRPHLIFTCNEETTGSGAFELSLINNPFNELCYVIELDRHGKNDCVFYTCDNPEFTKYIESFGFETDLGTYTDIDIFAPEWGIAAVNLSIGYYNEHSYVEYLNLHQWDETRKKVIKMLTKCPIGKFYYVPMKGIDYYERLDCEGEGDRSDYESLRAQLLGYCR